MIGEPWVGTRPDTPFDFILQEIAEANDAPAEVVQRFLDNYIVEAMVAAGFGLAILPRFTTDAPDIVTRTLTGVRASRVISAVMRPDRAERQSVRLVVEALQEQGRRVEAEHT